MKACDRYVNAIHELIDGTLGPLRRAELELHLESCDACRALAEDLRQIADVARSLEPMEPPDHVWLQVAGRLHQEGRVSAPPAGRRPNYTILALAAALILAVGSSLLLLLPRGREAAPPAPAVATHAPDAPESNAAAADPVQSVSRELAAVQQHIDNVLQQAGKSDGLPAEAVAVLQKNLQVMNDAVAESHAALKSDPQSANAQQSLYDLLKQKIQFLQNTIALMNEMRQGDAAGAARIVEGGKS